MPTSLAQRAGALRHFNRFYTRQAGLLAGQFLGSPFTLTEARVIYELAQHDTVAAASLGRELGLDPGYLSRIVRRFQRRGLLSKQPSATDGRQSLLRLTRKGQHAFQALDRRSQNDHEALLGALPAGDQARLVEAMRTIEALLDRPAAANPAASPAPAPARVVLRPPRPGDLGWVVARHGFLYAQEYGWDQSFEALVAEIVAGFVQHYDPQRERCWIAEQDGQNAGSVFLVKKTQAVAKLRLLLVEPAARGHGLGARLVDECLRFARQAGYRQVTLWTNSVLLAARHIYAQVGFRLVDSGPHHSFGHDLVEETWLLDL
jgi:DNA-binding MarR family transcriptional regulator/N-acetylglutamate synthase-like GNAT family acetyltransferase